MSLPTLGTPPPGMTEGYLTADLSATRTRQKNGYSFTLEAGAGAAAGPNDCNGTATATAWYAAATPERFGTTGARSFAANTKDGLWQNSTGAPPAEPFAAPSVKVR